MQRYPPRPRINTCVICRNDFMLAVSAEPRSLATACQAICSSRRCPHRSFRPGAMPIARMTSELRSVAAATAPAQRRHEACLEQRTAQHVLESRAAADQHAGSQRFQAAINEVQKYRDYGEKNQRPFVAAAEHAVVDLQHVKRADQRQQIDEQTEDCRRHKRRARRLDGVVERGRTAYCCHCSSPASPNGPAVSTNFSLCTTPAVSITLGNGEVDRVNLGEAGRNTITLGEGAGDEVNVSVLSGLKPDQPFAARSRRAPSPPTPIAAGRRRCPN